MAALGVLGMLGVCVAIAWAFVLADRDGRR
jgi:hypothetical protein